MGKSNMSGKRYATKVPVAIDWSLADERIREILRELPETSVRKGTIARDIARGLIKEFPNIRKSAFVPHIVDMLRAFRESEKKMETRSEETENLLGGAVTSEHDCCWPIGHPGEKGFRFCGAPAERRGRPYCEGHRKLSHASTPRESEMVLLS